jgi:hypothetical protein
MNSVYQSPAVKCLNDAQLSAPAVTQYANLLVFGSSCDPNSSGTIIVENDQSEGCFTTLPNLNTNISFQCLETGGTTYTFQVGDLLANGSVADCTGINNFIVEVSIIGDPPLTCTVTSFVSEGGCDICDLLNDPDCNV